MNRAIAKHILSLPCIALCVPGASAQNLAPITAVEAPKASTVLPRNTPVSLVLNDTLNSKSSAAKKGSTFALTVDRPVQMGNYIVIPRGSRATGTVIWRTGKGGFGKSGKMEVTFDYIDVGDTRVPIEGRHREEGQGNSTATVATFVFVSMLGSGLITGHSAEIPAGRQFTAWTKEDVPVRLPDGESARDAQPASGVLAAQLAPDVARRQMQAAARKPVVVGNSHVWCVTCR